MRRGSRSAPPHSFMRLVSSGGAGVWTYIIGPALVLTSRRWREEHLARFPVPWHRTTVISGIIETIVSLPLAFIWHDFFVTKFIAIYQRSGPVWMCRALTTESELSRTFFSY